MLEKNIVKNQAKIAHFGAFCRRKCFHLQCLQGTHKRQEGGGLRKLKPLIGQLFLFID